MKLRLSDRRILFPFIIVLLGTILMAITVFLPYATATAEYKEALAKAPNSIVDSELGLTIDNIENVSLFKFARIYNTDSYEIFGDGDGFIYMVMVALIGGFALLGTVFILFKKAIPVIVCTILSYLVFAFNNYDFSLRGIIPSDSYIYGSGYFIFYLAALLTAVGAVWMLISKIQIKKEHRDH